MYNDSKVIKYNLFQLGSQVIYTEISNEKL